MDSLESSGWSGEFQQSYPDKRPNYWADKENPRGYVAKWRKDIFEDFTNCWLLCNITI